MTQNKFPIYIFFLLIIISRCSLQKYSNNNDNNKFYILKIEKYSNINVIYAECGGFTYKILSKKKENCNNENLIKKGKYYNLNYNSLLLNRFLINNGDTIAIFYFYAINCVYYEDTTIVKYNNVYDIGIASNLCDLYIVD